MPFGSSSVSRGTEGLGGHTFGEEEESALEFGMIGRIGDIEIVKHPLRLIPLCTSTKLPQGDFALPACMRKGMASLWLCF